MPAIRIYSISENGEYLGEGTIGELEVWLNTSKKDIRKAVRERQLIGKYSVAFVREDKKNETEKGKVHLPEKKVKKVKEKEVDLLKDHLAYLAYHLRVYGNTSSEFDPRSYLSDLRDMGMNCRVSEVAEPQYIKRITKGRKKPNVHWYVEVVNETKGLRESV